MAPAPTPTPCPFQRNPREALQPPRSTAPPYLASFYSLFVREEGFGVVPEKMCQGSSRISAAENEPKIFHATCDCLVAVSWQRGKREGLRLQGGGGTRKMKRNRVKRKGDILHIFPPDGQTNLRGKGGGAYSIVTRASCSFRLRLFQLSARCDALPAGRPRRGGPGPPLFFPRAGAAASAAAARSARPASF